MSAKAAAQSGVVISPKSGVLTLLLCLFLGIFGAHRFYTGRIKTGIAMLLTLGGIGVWMLIDLVFIACDEYKDSDGRLVAYTQSGDSAIKYYFGMFAMLASVIGMYAIMVFLIAFQFLGNLAEPAYDQIAAIRAGDLKKAYYDYTSPAFRSITSFETFKQFVSQVPQLNDNQSASFNNRKFSNDQGILVGVLKGNDGSEQPIEYLLTYDKGSKSWKIAGINVSPDINQSVDDEEQANPKQQADESGEPSGLLRYTDPNQRYSIAYPSDWYHEEPDKSTVMFSGRKGSPAYYSTVTIQSLPMKKSGGMYKSVQDIVDDLKGQIKEKTTDVNYVKQGNATLPKNTKYTGQYFEVTYTYKDQAMHKIQYILVAPDGKEAYSWGYTTPSDRYQEDYPIAAEMYQSWDVK